LATFPPLFPPVYGGLWGVIEIPIHFRLWWGLKDKKPIAFYPPLNPLPRGDFSNSPLERGRGCVYS